jgi:hypothetical protein
MVTIQSKQLDALSVDIKNPLSEVEYRKTRLIIESCNYYNVELEFRTTLYPDLTKENIAEIDKQLNEIKNLDSKLLFSSKAGIEYKFKHIKQRFIIPPQGE